MDESKIILSMIYRDYVCTEDKRKDLKKYIESITSENYKKDRLVFENEKNIKNELINEEKWYKKFINKIKSILKELRRW